MSEHGGNIYRFAKINNVSEKQVLDFSASINPLGLPETVISEIRKIDSSMYHYPDPDTTQLKKTFSEYHNLAPESIIFGNGSTELIYLSARALNPKKVLIPMPTFSEYERACLFLNAKIRYYILSEENYFDISPNEFINKMAGCDLAFICNPNNPTGRLIPRDNLINIANAAKDLKCYLIVDEAFIDFTPDNSIIHEVQENPYLIILRSLTKFYALSALRLGFGVFNTSIVWKILEYKEPWTVNTLAQMAGIASLKDEEYKERALKTITEAKKLMEDGFKRLSIQFFPSPSNFYLLKIPYAQEVVSFLSKANIMVRNCSNFKGLNSSYIRVAVKSKEDNERLLKELSKL